MEIARKHHDRFECIKKNIRQSYEYFKPNYERYHIFRREVFNTFLNDSEFLMLRALNKPEIEFNILEAYISRLLGEWSKQEPSLSVSAEDGSVVDASMINIVESHIRHICEESNKKKGLYYNVYKETVSGGFSAIKVFTDYAHPKSFDQVIMLDKAFDPTLCGWDHLAREPHKGDGRFCYELYPMPKHDFEQEFSNVDLSKLKFTRTLQGFEWSYTNDKEDVVLVCDYYEKKKKKTKIVQLATGHVTTYDMYQKYLKIWESLDKIEQPISIVSERYTDIETIIRYRLIESQLLEVKETDYRLLPIVFVDGNSAMIRQGTSQSYFQMTRPLLYHARGAQKLKNFAGQTLANEIEMLVQHKFMVAEEALPDEGPYLEAYKNIQVASTLVHKAFKDDDPNVPVPPPQVIPRVPPPAEVTNTFVLMDQLTQGILGSYDASLGINNNQLSGVAIVEGATQSNAAAMPYVVSFMQSLTQVGNIIVDLIPKYYTTPRTIPLQLPNGKRGCQKINQQDGITFNYDENVLNVKVEAGVSFSIAKQRALNTIIRSMQSNPALAEFFATDGLPVYVKNLEIHGADQLEQAVTTWQQKKAQERQIQMQMAQQAASQNPQMIKAQNERIKLQQNEKIAKASLQLEAAELAVSKQAVDNEMLKIMADIKNKEVDAAAKIDRDDAERARAAVDLAIKVADLNAKHNRSSKNYKEMKHE